jgi:hypothetical protein
MADTNKPPIKSWSFSALETYKRCPQAALWRYGEKRPTLAPAKNSPLVRGKVLHEAQERYLKGETNELPKPFAPWKETYDLYRELYTNGTCTVEEEWAFTSALEQTGWLDDDCWLRVKCDVVIHHDANSLTIEDLKTGKRWGNEVKHLHQGQIYAFAGFVRYPEVSDVLVVFRYPDQQHQVIQKHYDRDKAFHQMTKHNQRGIEMTTATEFPPKPNVQNCKFCDYGSLNGNSECPFAVEPL